MQIYYGNRIHKKRHCIAAIFPERAIIDFVAQNYGKDKWSLYLLEIWDMKEEMWKLKKERQNEWNEMKQATRRNLNNERERSGLIIGRISK